MFRANKGVQLAGKQWRQRVAAIGVRDPRMREHGTSEHTVAHTHGKPRRSNFARAKLREQQQQQAVTEAVAALTEGQAAASGRDLRMAQLTDAVFSRGPEWVGSASNVSYVPHGNPAMPEVAFAGRAGVGSSSLLGALFKNNAVLRKAKRRPNANTINYFDVGRTLRVAETPGFGTERCTWLTVLQHCALLRNFVQCRPNLKMLYYLVDIAPGSEGLAFRDLDTLRFLSEEIRNFTIVLTKADLGSVPAAVRELQFHGVEHPTLATSASRLGGIDALRFDMVSNALHSLPSRHLSMAEAGRLSERLLSSKEWRSLAYPEGDPRNHTRRSVHPPALPSLAEAQWDATFGDDTAAADGSGGAQLQGRPSEEEPSSPSGVATGEEVVVDDVVDGVDDDVSAAFTEAEVDAHLAEVLEEQSEPPDQVAAPSHRPSSLPTTAEASEAHRTAAERLASEMRTVDGSPLPAPLRRPEQLRFVAETSPWRNPLSWPSFVLPTANRKRNLVLCPDDPANPYLVQSRFAVPRADMSFQRPTYRHSRGLAMKNRRGRGQYVRLSRRENEVLARGHTVPFFPEITDVSLKPLPFAFAGSYSAYFLNRDLRQLALASHRHITAGTDSKTEAGLTVVNPLLEDPGGTSQPELTAAVKKLEAREQSIQLAARLKLMNPPPKPQA